mmetsp:Transcript_29692/g.89912  ORF Transcript_29692/g.89912 Transcript_29692/m.89912 type:complete len:315 (-) Transcript_29692:801-1745(-)
MPGASSAGEGGPRPAASSTEASGEPNMQASGDSPPPTSTTETSGDAPPSQTSSGSSALSASSSDTSTTGLAEGLPDSTASEPDAAEAAGAVVQTSSSSLSGGRGSAALAVTRQSPLVSKAISSSSASVFAKMCSMYTSTDKSFGGLSSVSQTGQRHRRLNAAMRKFETMYAFKSKHCKCLHRLPRAGVSSRDSVIGQSNRQRSAPSSALTSSPVLSSLDENRSCCTLWTDSSSLSTLTFVINCFGSCGAVLTKAKANRLTKMSCMLTSKAFIPVRRFAEILRGASRRLWPAFGAATSKAFRPFTWHTSVVGHVW